jgi:hypothetical protein
MCRLGAIAGRIRPVGDLAPLDPIDLVDLLAGRSIVDREVLRAVQDDAFAAIERLLAGGGIRRGANADLRLVVAVEVASDHRREPDTEIDVPSEVDAPEKPAGAAVVAIELVGVGTGPDASGIDVAGGMLHHEIVGAVAVQIGDRHAIDALHVLFQPDGAEKSRRRAGGKRNADGLVLLAPVYDRLDEPDVLAIERRARVSEVGRPGQRFRGELDRRAAISHAVHVERDVRRIGLQQSPPEIDAARLDQPPQGSPVQHVVDPALRPPQRNTGLVEGIDGVENSNWVESLPASAV